jgi:putative ABC transport system ATP-binding protein
MNGDPTAATAPPLIDIAGLAVQRGRGADGFRLEVDSFLATGGDRIAVVGPSGSGKSTFLDLLALTLAPGSAERFRLGIIDAAATWLAGDSGKLADLRSQGIGYILQTGGLLGFLSARENARLPLRLLGRSTDPADRLLEHLGVDGIAGRKPQSLSIGQRQRVAIARALAHRPPIVLADEPTASLDGENAGEVMKLLVTTAAELGCCVILVTHDTALAERNGFRIVTCRSASGGDGPAIGRIGDA